MNLILPPPPLHDGYMTEILSIRHKTIFNQSIDHSTNQIVVSSISYSKSKFVSFICAKTVLNGHSGVVGAIAVLRVVLELKPLQEHAKVLARATGRPGD